MTHEEKAKELTSKFNLLVTTWDCYNDTEIPDGDILKDTKKCALIVVDEILASFTGFMDSRKHFRHSSENEAIEFWIGVKTAINNL